MMFWNSNFLNLYIKLILKCFVSIVLRQLDNFCFQTLINNKEISKKNIISPRFFMLPNILNSMIYMKILIFVIMLSIKDKTFSKRE